MTVNLRFRPLELIDHRSAPIKRVTITGKLENTDRRCVSVFSLTAQIVLAEETGFVVGTACEVRVFNPTIAPGKQSTAHVLIDLPTPILSAIEDRRRSTSSGAVALRLFVEGVGAPLTTIADQNGQPLSDPVLGPAESACVDVRDPTDRDTFAIPRDTWLELLRRVRYGESEVFEIQSFTLEGTSEHSRRMIERLNEAVAALRTHDPSGALAKCRQAFEGLATGFGAGNTKKGFEIVFEAARPGAIEAPKRDALNKIMTAIAEFQHLGRHDKPPFTAIDRLDGELTVQIALALAHYLSRLLARNTPPSA